MKYEPLEKVTLTEQIMEQITGVITSGQLKPGGKLPNERDLAELFGITRSRIRKTLRALSPIEMSTIKPGGGNFASEEGTEVLEEAVIWIHYQEMNKHDEIYAARSLIGTEVYLTCYNNRTPKILGRLDGFRDRLLDVETEGITAKAFCQLLAGVGTYVGDVYSDDIYARLIRIMMSMGRESAMEILSLASSRENVVSCRYEVLNSFHQDDRNKVGKCPNDFFKYSIGETPIQEQMSYRMIKGQLTDRQLTLQDIA